ncbi:uncharacterized protein LOC114257495 isoform X3 [Camellia sinensis]|uniref:uncharacterized protein LOC114257495 isoform X3 n=1 Tax=Camellia sinensis TaxID=4442 RepID=UPI0010368808|nr:uncharacterized protein LOC114257495 isoform X3 [Camellia sinensis]
MRSECLVSNASSIRFQLASIVKERMPLNVINMLGQLREAKSITLSLSTLEVLAMDPDSLRSHPSPFHKLKHLQLTQGGSSSSLSLPLNVINYLSQGLSCGGTLVMNFFPRCKWKAFTMKNDYEARTPPRSLRTSVGHGHKSDTLWTGVRHSP